jgi:murein tripeptide amidase MpaA
LKASLDFQTKEGYPKGRFTEEMLTLAVNHVVGTFQCPGYTLEMPFKDNANQPDAKEGWSIERSKVLGAQSLEAMNDLADVQLS